MHQCVQPRLDMGHGVAKGRRLQLREVGADPGQVQHASIPGARVALFLYSNDASFIAAAKSPVNGGYPGIDSEALGEYCGFSGLY